MFGTFAPKWGLKHPFPQQVILLLNVQVFMTEFLYGLIQSATWLARCVPGSAVVKPTIGFCGEGAWRVIEQSFLVLRTFLFEMLYVVCLLSYNVSVDITSTSAYTVCQPTGNKYINAIYAWWRNNMFVNSLSFGHLKSKCWPKCYQIFVAKIISALASKIHYIIHHIKINPSCSCHEWD